MTYPYQSQVASRNGDYKLGYMLSGADLAARQGSGFVANSGDASAYIHNGSAVAVAGPDGTAVATAPPRIVEVHKKRRFCCGIGACCLAILIVIGILIVAGIITGVVYQQTHQASSGSEY